MQRQKIMKIIQNLGLYDKNKNEKYITCNMISCHTIGKESAFNCLGLFNMIVLTLALSSTKTWGKKYS